MSQTFCTASLSWMSAEQNKQEAFAAHTVTHSGTAVHLLTPQLM